MLESFIVILLVAGAVVLASRSVWKTLTGDKPECGCSGKSGCCSSASRRASVLKASEIHEASPDSRS